MARTTIRIPFGEGVERADGAMVVQPSTFRDLRNVHLTGMRTEVRKGLEQKAIVTGGVTDILAIHPMRAALQSLVVAYNATTRVVTLYRAAIDPSTLAVTLTAVSGDMWTIPVTAPFPIVQVTDSYGKAYIAHNETSFSARQDTQIFDPATDTYENLLYNEDTMAPMNLRGVRRWLSYIVGWGYGTSDEGPPDDRNRSEILRLSKPGDPDIFDPNYYVIVGQRGEPIVGVAQCQRGLVVAKEGELHLLTGTNPTDFDITLIDPNFGAIAGAGMVEVSGDVYFWSGEGPRVTQGNGSVDLGLPLDLKGLLADEILTASDLRYCHGTFRPDREEIEWIFPASGRDASFAYVLDLKDPNSRRWSYRRYSRLVRCSGLLAGNVAFDPGDPSVAPYIELTDLLANAGSYYDHTVEWDNTNVANLPASSVVEIWASGGSGAFVISGELPWVKVKEVAAAGASQTDSNVEIGTAATAQAWRHVAVRYRLLDGTYYPSSQSSNPMDWPVNSRLSLLGPTRPEITGTTLAWDGVAAETSPVVPQWNNSNIANLDSGAEVEIWGMGGEFLGGPGIAPDTWQLEQTVTAAGGTQSQTGIVIGQQRRHVALRYKINGAYYAHSQSADPWSWPAGARASILLDGPRPIASFAWDVSSGFNRSPGVLTFTFPDAGIAPAGAWTLEVYTALWDSSKPWSPSDPDFAAWSLFDTQGYNPQPPLTKTYSVSTLNSSYKAIFAARLILNGFPRPYAPYASNDPSDWPAVSRIIVDYI